MAIGERITEARERLGLTKGELSRRIEVRPETIGRYEAGHLTPRAEAIARLAETLSVTTDFLMGRDTARGATSEPVHDDAVLDMVAQVVAELQLPAEVETALRAHPWSTGLPSYGTLRSYAVDLMGQRSGKLRSAPTTKVDVGEDDMKRVPKGKRRD